MIDDFDSPQSLAWFNSQMQEVFPERGFEEMLDIGDFWEWLDQPRYPLQGTIAGVRLGINYLLFSMSH